MQKVFAQKPVRLIETSISFEPLQDELPQEIREQIDSLLKMLPKNPKKALGILEQFIEKYPNVPKIYNWQLVAYQYLNHDEEFIKKKIIEQYEKFPDYLFAKCAYANICFKQNEWEKIPSIFNNKFVINDLYPTRTIFHVSEIFTLYNVIGKYFCYKKNFQQAKIYLDLLGSIDKEYMGAYQDLLITIVEHFPEKSTDFS